MRNTLFYIFSEIKTTFSKINVNYSIDNIQKYVALKILISDRGTRYKFGYSRV